MLPGIHVNDITDTCNFTRNETCACLHEHGSAVYEPVIVHPEQRSVESTDYVERCALCKNASAGHVDLPIELHRDRLTPDSVRDSIFTDIDRLYRCLRAAGQRRQFIALPKLSCLDLSLEASERVIRPADPLNRQIKALFAANRINLHSLQIVEQRFAVIPAHELRFSGNVFPFCRGERDNLYVLKPQVIFQLTDMRTDPLERLFCIPCQVHFIDCKNKILNSHESADPRMAPGLDQDSFRGIYQDHSKIRKARANSHVPRVFFMARRICDDEAAAVSGKIAIGHVDGDSLLPLRHETVKEERVINLSSARSHAAI